MTIITDQSMVVIPYILAILVFHFLGLLLLPLTLEDEPLCYGIFILLSLKFYEAHDDCLTWIHSYMPAAW